jgi:peptide deformylase
MILPILKYGDPRLTTRAEDVEEIDDEIRKLVEDMFETLYNEPGIGLAANQVGVLKQVAVVDLSIGEDPAARLVLINPVIIEEEGEQTAEEGCLSFPEIEIEIKRPERLVVKALDLEGEEYTLEAGNLLARAICHEIDHLNGKVIIDYQTGLAKQMTLTTIKRLKRQGNWD